MARVDSVDEMDMSTQLLSQKAKFSSLLSLFYRFSISS